MTPVHDKYGSGVYTIVLFAKDAGGNAVAVNDDDGTVPDEEHVITNTSIFIK
jgi:hypothetical protein